MYACKKALSVSQKTPNAMIYGEPLGRYPFYINTVMNLVKYWLKRVDIPDDRLPKAVCEPVKSLDDKGVKIWASDIRTCLFPYAFGIVRVSQVGNKTETETRMTASVLKQDRNT